LYQSIRIKKVEIDQPSDHYDHLAAIFDYLGTALDTTLPIQRWGKCVIPGDITLRSRMSEEVGQASRSSRYFKLRKEMSLFLGKHWHSTLGNRQTQSIVWWSIINY
jgi:hypothetical protein